MIVLHSSIVPVAPVAQSMRPCLIAARKTSMESEIIMFYAGTQKPPWVRMKIYKTGSLGRTVILSALGPVGDRSGNSKALNGLHD